MKKRFNFGRLGALALALTLVTSCLTGGTLAKYTTSVDGTGTAMVAKWAFKAGNTAESSSFVEKSLDLKDTTVDENVIANGKIAPGVEGKLPIYVDLSGTEVATEIEITISSVEENNTLPENLYFINSNGKKIKANTLTTGGIVFNKVSLTATDAANYKEKDLSISWKWPYETEAEDGTQTKGNTADTSSGETFKTSNIKVTVTGTQLDKDPTLAAP